MADTWGGKVAAFQGDTRHQGGRELGFGWKGRLKMGSLFLSPCWDLDEGG